MKTLFRFISMMTVAVIIASCASVARPSEARVELPVVESSVGKTEPKAEPKPEPAPVTSPAPAPAMAKAESRAEAATAAPSESTKAFSMEKESGIAMDKDMEVRPSMPPAMSPLPPPAVSADMSSAGSPVAPTAAKPASAVKPASAAPAESGLKAGFADDNAQYNYFLSFVAENRGAGRFREIPLANRIMVRVVDETGARLPNVALSVKNPDGVVADAAKTYADGQAIITPPADAAGAWRLIATAAGAASGRSVSADLAFTVDGPRTLEIVLPVKRQIAAPVPLDLVFVLDTTGSMGEEIERLKATIDIIRDNLDLAKPRPSLRFGLVLYKDRGDEYIVQRYPLTSDMDKFRKNLAKANADGGGDEPEDLEAALAAAVSSSMGWSGDGARLVFVITDAPAQTYKDGVGYNASAEEARNAGIKIHTVGTGGLPLSGEYQLRQIAQRTRGRYIFLTYGEGGESGGGEAGAVSHHTGANWTAERLEAIIIRFAKEELNLLSETAVETPMDDWYEAKPVAARSADDILDELFAETIGRLIDYSSVAVTGGTAAAILPTAISDQAQAEGDPRAKRNAERFGARLLQAAIGAKRFRLVERDDLQAVLAELELSLSAIGSESDVIRIGNLIGADVLLAPTLIPLGDATGSAAKSGEATEWELYVKLIRVGTAELLSVARARIGYGLGIE